MPAYAGMTSIGIGLTKQTSSAAHRKCLVSLARGKSLFGHVIAFFELYGDLRQAPLVISDYPCLPALSLYAQTK